MILFRQVHFQRKTFSTASFPLQTFDMKFIMKSGIIKMKFKTIATQSENTHFSTSKTPFYFISLLYSIVQDLFQKISNISSIHVVKR